METNKQPIAISREVINGIHVIRDNRHNPPRNIGLIKPRPFNRGFHYCPSVKMNLHFSCLRKEIPREWRTAERAWKWTVKYASDFKKKRYTFFNPLIKWVAYMPHLFFLLRDFQFQLIIVKFILGGALVLGAYYTENQNLSIALTGLAVFIGITTLLDTALFVHKWRSRN